MTTDQNADKPPERNKLPAPFANSTLASRAGKAPKPKPGGDGNSTFADRVKASGRNKRVDRSQAAAKAVEGEQDEAAEAEAKPAKTAARKGK